MGRGQPCMAWQQLPAAGGPLRNERVPIFLMQPTAAQVLLMGTLRGVGLSGPWVKQVATQPQLRIELINAQSSQQRTAFRP